MTAYQHKTFTVPTGQRDPATCTHGWIRPNGECQFCGTKPLVAIDATFGAGWTGPPPLAINPTGWTIAPIPPTTEPDP